MSKSARSPITTHVLDLARGRAASGVGVTLQFDDVGKWREIARGKTNADGRVEDLLAPGSQALVGTYQLLFDTQTYFDSLGLRCFYPQVAISFHLADPAQHYHIPLLLSPYGYSTYRGT